MKKELREKILAYNRVAAARKEKADDLDMLLSAMMQMAPSQLQNLLPDEVLAMLEKYGIISENGT